MAMLPFSDADSDQGINEQLLREYAFFLAKKAGEPLRRICARYARS
jgi:hypothetical protein